MTSKRVLATNDHGGPIKLSPSDKIYPNHTGTNPEIKKTITLNLSEWPQLSLHALEKYEKGCIAAKGNYTSVGTDLLEHPVHSMSYLFPPEESKFIAGFDVSIGARAFTMYPKPGPILLLRKMEAAIKRILAGASTNMRENHVQHIHIHPRGIPRHIHLSTHTHFVYPSGKKISKVDVAMIVSAAAQLGLINPPYKHSDVRKGRELVRHRELSSSALNAYERDVIRSIVL